MIPKKFNSGKGKDQESEKSKCCEWDFKGTYYPGHLHQRGIKD